MVQKTQKLILTLLLGSCLFLSACGQKETVEPSSGDSSPSPDPRNWEDVVNPDGTMNWDKYNQHLGIDASQLEASKEETSENVILLGAKASDYEYIQKPINAFNLSQSEYQVKVNRYGDTDSMFLDLARGQGCDLLLLSPVYLTTLSDKGGLEDLTPYFDKSEKAGRENLFDAVLETGTSDGKLVGVMPDFTVDAILVEKGYTENGGWTIEEYLALMDKYPDVPLSSNIYPQAIHIWMMFELSALPETFVNWEERTCDFESETFIQTIETLKSYMERCRKREIDYTMSLSDRLYRKQFQTMLIKIDYDQYFSSYVDIRDAFLEYYELAGLPTQDGKARYSMSDISGDTLLYSMNSASLKKDAAWLFLEYMLSEYQETIAETGAAGFPARRDIVERKLQEEVEAESSDKYYTRNYYTDEERLKRGSFTEEDKEQVLYILDHAAPPTTLQRGGAFRTILTEELDAFFAGDKTAAETAHVIQNKMTTYLSE